MLGQEVGGCANGGKGQLGAARDVEQRVLAMGEVQDPEHRELEIGNARAADRAVETSAAELRLAPRARVLVLYVVLQDLDDVAQDPEGFREARGGDERKVVARRVVLGKF